MRRHVSWILSLLVCASALGLATKTPKANTRAEVKAYVERAAKFVAKHGPSCSALQSKEWQNGDYYIFVVGPDDKLLCHPIASMVGTSGAAHQRLGCKTASALNWPLSTFVM